MKKLPTKEKGAKLKAMLTEQQQKRMSDMASSIANRVQFLQTTDVKNKKMEADRLRGLLQNGPMAYTTDGNYRPIRLSDQQRTNLQARQQRLNYEVRNAQPIIGAQGRYLFA
jgi:hypothetical protein